MNRSYRVLTTLMLFAVAAFSNPAHAGDIDFTFNHSCSIDTCPDGTPRNLTIPDAAGYPATDTNYISMVNSIPVTGGNQAYGSLQFSSAPASSVYVQFDQYSAYFNGPPAGTFTISGSVPGASGPLLSGYFLPGGTGDWWDYGSSTFKSPVYITYANPTLLSDLGMPGASDHGYGELSDSFYDDGPPDQYWQWSVSLDFTPSPEPSSLLLFGSGVLGLGGLLRKRFLG
jgi:PEP-CTERM motif